jgi:hypothetical protein
MPKQAGPEARMVVFGARINGPGTTPITCCSNFYAKYPTAQEVPEDQRAYLTYLQQINQSSFDRAESLGWRPLQR